MKLRTHIALLNIVILVVTVAFILPVFIGMIKHQENRAIKETRSSLMTQTKIRLKDVVDTVYCLIQERYNSIHNRDHMIAKYGIALRSVVAAIEEFAKSQHQPHTAVEKLPALTQFNNYLPQEIIPMLLTTDDNTEEMRAVINAAKERKEGFVFTPHENTTLIYFKRITENEIIAAAGISRQALIAAIQQEIKNISRKFLFDSGAAYVFILDSSQRFLVYPPSPEFENQHLATITEFDNQKFVADWLNVCNLRGQGFVRYSWQKLLSFNSTEEYPKLSFVKIFTPWQWVIGASEYLDGFFMANRIHVARNQVTIKAMITKILLVASGVISIMILLATFFASSISRPISKLIKLMKTVRTDELSRVSVVLKGSHEISELGKIFNKTINSVNSGIKKIQKTAGAKELARSELKIVQEIQRYLLPSLNPQSPPAKEFDIDAIIQPGRPVGGDFYDFFFIDSNHFCLAIGDVSGKGVSSTLLGVITRTLLRAKAVKGLQAGEIVTGINRNLCLSGSNQSSVQLFLAILNPSNGNLFYTNAGCTPSYLIRNNHSVESLPVIHGEPLGSKPNSIYEEELVSLQRGERLVLCTNGLIKAVNFIGKQYGTTRLHESLQDTCNCANAAQTVERLTLHLNDFIGSTKFKDDVAILTLRFDRNKA